MSDKLDKILAERGKTHGEYSEQARISQDIKYAVRQGISYDSLTPYQVESVEMIAHKIARIVVGDPMVEDHWRDIAGYATLVADRINNPTPRVVNNKDTLG